MMWKIEVWSVLVVNKIIKFSFDDKNNIRQKSGKKNYIQSRVKREFKR